MTDPNPAAIDPDIWKDFFETHFGPVFMVTVTLANGALLRLFKQKAFIENEMHLERIEEHQFLDMAREESKAAAKAAKAKAKAKAGEEAEEEAKGREEEDEEEDDAPIAGGLLSDRQLLESLEARQSAKPWLKRLLEAAGLDPTLESLSVQLLTVKIQIRDELRRAVRRARGTHKRAMRETKSLLPPRLYDACKVFVTFESEQSQRECLEKMTVGLVPALLDRRDVIDPKFLFHGNLLHVHEAPEPSSVQYEFLDKGFDDHVFEQARSWAIMVAILVLTYFTVTACFDQGQPVLGAIMISFWNGLIPEAVRLLVTSLESHHTFGGVEDSFLAKTIAGRWFTSSVVLYVSSKTNSHMSAMPRPYSIIKVPHM